VAVKVFIDGAIHDEAGAVVSVFDRGFLYGDSVYEVMRTAGGHPVDFERHLARLRRSAEAIWLACPDDATLTAAVRDTLAAGANPESYVRIVLTRGAGDIGLDVALADRTRTVIIARALSLPDAELYRTGASLRIVEVQRNSPAAVDPAVKSGNYLNNILALAEARRHGAYEAVMLSAGGTVAEGSSSNVFAARGGQLITPAIGVGLLVGITRHRILELAGAAGIPITEAALSAGELLAADEVFITSSVRGVMPIGRIDDRILPAPGPITSELMRRYDQFLAAEAARGPL
jgi:branched-chain amino acid aminotransferase